MDQNTNQNQSGQQWNQQGQADQWSQQSQQDQQNQWNQQGQWNQQDQWNQQGQWGQQNQWNQKSYGAPAPVKPPRKWPSAGVKAGSALLIFITTILSFMLASVLSLRMISSEKIVKKIYKSADLEETIRSNLVEGDSDFARMITEGLEQTGVSQEQMEEIMEELEISDFMEDYIQQFADYVINGGNPPTIEEEDYLKLLEDNEEIIEEITGYELYEEDFEMIQEQGGEYLKEFNDEIRDFADEYEKSAVSVHMFVSDEMFIGMIIGLAVLLLLLILIYKCSGTGVYRAFRGYAYPLGCVGVIFLAFSTVVSAAVEQVAEGEDEVIIEIVEHIFQVVQNSGIIFLAACAVCIVLAIVSYIFYRSSFSKQ